jgi:hypothetical protein
MSISGMRIRNRRIARCIRNTHAAQISRAGEPLPANTPYRLLWSTGIAALVLCIAAFVLWGTNGAGTLFDMMVAFCT